MAKIGYILEDVILPQIGPVRDSKLTKWHKGVGSRINRDEMLFDISNSFVDAEIPSPYSGEIAEIIVKAGETALVGAVLARIKREVTIIDA